MPGVLARYAAPDTLLVLQRDGSIVVAPFDARTGRLTGAATPVVRGLHPSLMSNEGSFVVSRGGRLVVVTKGTVAGDSYDLVRVTRGGAVAPLDTSWTGRFLSTAVSRDGAKVAVGATAEGNWEIQVRDLRTRAQVRVSSRGILWEDPSFSPSGDALLVDSLGVNGGGVFRVPLVATTVPERLWTPVNGTVPESPRYSADGATIYYSAYDVASGATSLRSRSAASPGKDLETVADGDGDVSPDGRWVAYVSTESGAAGLYVRPRAAGSSERWLVSPGATGVPRWAPGGRELVFSAGDSIYAVAVQGGQTFTAGARRALVGLKGFRPAFDLFPNGDLLMLRQRSASGATSLTMIENWRAALGAR
jgi:serine/threonine-protein kinase